MLVYRTILAFTVLWNCSVENEPVEIPDTGSGDSHIETFGGSKNESAQSIIKTVDGGYAVLGYTQSRDHDIENKENESFDYWLLKFNADHVLEWQKTYGGTDDDRGSNLIQTNDGGFAIFGYSQSDDGDLTTNAGSRDFWILKLDNSGNISWQKPYGFAGADQGISVLQTNDGGYLLTGVLDVTASGGQGISKTTLAFRHAGGDYWAIKLDASGNKQWSNYYGGTFTDTPYDVIQTEDHGFIIVGSSDSNDVDIKNNKGAYDFWVTKISETGTLVWEKSFGGSEVDEARAIVPANDSNYIIIGDTRSSDLDVSENKGAADLWIIKISPSGNLIWEKTFGGTSFDSGRSISKTQDGGYLISGNSRSSDGDLNTNQGQNDVWILKLNNEANLEWQKTIGGSGIDLSYDAIELNNGTIIATGESGSSNADINENKGFTDLLIVKIE